MVAFFLHANVWPRALALVAILSCSAAFLAGYGFVGTVDVASESLLVN